MTFSPERAPENCAYPPHPAAPAGLSALGPGPGRDAGARAHAGPGRVAGVHGRLGTSPFRPLAPARTRGRVPLAAAPVSGRLPTCTLGVHGTFTGAAAAIAAGIAYGIGGEKHAAWSVHPRSARSPTGRGHGPEWRVADHGHDVGGRWRAGTTRSPRVAWRSALSRTGFCTAMRRLLQRGPGAMPPPLRQPPRQPG